MSPDALTLIPDVPETSEDVGMVRPLILMLHVKQYTKCRATIVNVYSTVHSLGEGIVNGSDRCASTTGNVRNC